MLFLAFFFYEIISYFNIFFFQAEDGIRDLTVTGVQTCALPILDEELRAPSEEVLERGVPFVGVEAVLLVDADPGQRLTPPRQLVAAPRELLLLFQQREPRR